jgi:hypothetical protein
MHARMHRNWPESIFRANVSRQKYKAKIAIASLHAINPEPDSAHHKVKLTMGF